VCALRDLIVVRVMLNPSAEHFATPCGCPLARIDFHVVFSLTILAPEQDLVHDASWHKPEEPSNQQGSAEQSDHRLAMALRGMAVRLPDAQREHDERQDRQQMDRAPGAP
jgi:hypothetical protein